MHQKRLKHHVIMLDKPGVGGVVREVPQKGKQFLYVFIQCIGESSQGPLCQKSSNSPWNLKDIV
jgi:hypothetical protein